MTGNGESSHRATILDPDGLEDRRLLERLRADVTVEFVDRRDQQLLSLRALRPPPSAGLVTEPTMWAYYPWRRTVVGVLGRNAFRELRLDRNRNLITRAEQDRLGALAVGVVGLSVGHAAAYLLAAQGTCGRLRLADFDELELSNLNRVPATVFDLGVNKAVVAARRIAELDPYLDVEVVTTGLTRDSLDTFFDGLDVVIEECDALDVKAMAREAARARGIPVLMTTSDRGLLDVERFDLDPDRPILHGIFGDADSTRVAEMTAREKLPFTLRHADPTRTSTRITASLVEVGRTLSSWPQLAGEVTLGGAIIADAVRRIGLGQPLSSGQTRLDVADALDAITDPLDAEPVVSPSAVVEDRVDATAVADVVAAAAARAPSGGNAQPWHIDACDDRVVIALAPGGDTLMNVASRGSAVAVGAAVFNARVAASAHDRLGEVEWSATDGSPLTATVRLGAANDPTLSSLYQPMLQRETNRRHGEPGVLPEDVVALLHEAVRREGAELTLLTERNEVERAAALFAEADRIRYLTPRLHEELVAELRWPGDQPEDTGIDVRSLELDPSDEAVLQILRRSDVTAELGRWRAGSILGADIAARVRAASALGVVTVYGSDLADYARGGAAVEAAWILAETRGMAVHPLSPTFLHAVRSEELSVMSPAFAPELIRLHDAFKKLASTPVGHSHVLVLKFSRAAAASVRSRRRPS